MRLVVTSPDSSHLTKSKKISMAKCAKACSRNRRLPFTCRYVCSYVITPSANVSCLSHSNGCLFTVCKVVVLVYLNYAVQGYNALSSVWSSRPPNCFATHVTVVLIALSLLIAPRSKTKLTFCISLFPFSLLLLSSLFSRAFLYDHKNRKCQWLSFDKNSPGVQSQQDFNYQLYQKKGDLYCSTFPLKYHLPCHCISIF